MPVVQIITGSGTNPYDLYVATTSVPTMPAVKPMLYRLKPMCALNSCAAAGARMKPMTRLVTTASGTRISTASAVLNRISEKTGASAAPKNAVLTWAENASPLNRAYRKTPRTIDQMLRRFLPNRPNPSTRNRQATAAPVTLAAATR